MTTSPIEAVLAGSRGFALALLAPLTERVGTRPRVASDPAQALPLCGVGSLIVIEFAGEDSLRAIKDLVLQAPTLRIVAAVPEAHAAAEAPLRALGVELARWDGRPDGVLDAVTRRMEAAARKADAAAPRPASAARASAGVSPRAPASAAAPPARRAPPEPPSGARLAAAGAAPGSAPPERAPRPGSASPPAARAVPGTQAPAAAAAPPPPPAPSAAGSNGAPPPGAAPRPPARSAAGRPPAAGATAQPGAAPPAPAAPAGAASGTAASASAALPVPAPPAPEAPTAAAAGEPPAASALFEGLPGQEDDDFDLDVSDGQDALAPAVPALDPAPGGAWPAGVPGAAAAEDALARGLVGLFDPPDAPLGVVADVVAGLSELERAVLEGEPQPVDAGPIRRAAVMRVRVAAALATAPREGGAVDAAAVSAFLAEIDALLSEVGALAASAPPELQPSLEAVRNALVKEAIDFSEASHRGVPLEEAAAAGAAAARASRAAQQTRIVSVASQAEVEIEQALGKRRRAMVFALAASIALAAAYHGYGFWRSSRAAEEPPVRSGLPANARFTGDPTGKALGVVRSRDGAAFAPDEVRRLAELESLKGNAVHEVAKGVVVIVPGGEGKPPASPPVPRR